jgi:hypothetical protein
MIESCSQTGHCRRMTSAQLAAQSVSSLSYGTESGIKRIVPYGSSAPVSTRQDLSRKRSSSPPEQKPNWSCVRQGLQFRFPKSCAFVVRYLLKLLPSSVVFFLPGHDVGVGWSEAPAEPGGRSVLGRSGSRCPHRVRRRSERLRTLPCTRRRSCSETTALCFAGVFRRSLLSRKDFSLQDRL